MNGQLKCEYKIGSSQKGNSTASSAGGFEDVTVALSDLVFGELMRVALMEDKCLLGLDLDKEASRPYEEVIEFGRINMIKIGGATANEKVNLLS